VLVRLRSIGDAILMTPLARAIKRDLPDVEVSLLLEPTPASLLADQPDVDRVVEVPRSLAGRVRALRWLRSHRADAIIDLHGGPTAALLTRWSGARRRIGLAAYRQRGAYDERLPSPFKGRERALTLHTVTSNIAVARSLGLDPPADLAPRLSVTAAGREDARRALVASALAGQAPDVVLHAGAALRSKRWPVERLTAVGRALAQDGLRVASVRAPGEPATIDDDAIVALPPLALPALLAVLAVTRLFIGNDSGPAHMAAAVGTPAVTVFGSQDPQVWRPWGDRQTALSAGLECAPCAGFTCANPRRFACLLDISTEQVLNAARTRIDERA